MQLQWVSIGKAVKRSKFEERWQRLSLCKLSNCRTLHGTLKLNSLMPLSLNCLPPVTCRRFLWWSFWRIAVGVGWWVHGPGCCKCFARPGGTQCSWLWKITFVVSRVFYWQVEGGCVKEISWNSDLTDWFASTFNSVYWGLPFCERLPAARKVRGVEETSQRHTSRPERNSNRQFVHGLGCVWDGYVGADTAMERASPGHRI